MSLRAVVRFLEWLDMWLWFNQRKGHKAMVLEILGSVQNPS